MMQQFPVGDRPSQLATFLRPTQQLTELCGVSGGVLDALLDIVGQCTPCSKKGNTSAEATGCGGADVKNIRSNCCSLISLLVAVLATTSTGSSASDTTEVEGVESDKHICPPSEHHLKEDKPSSRNEAIPLLPEAPRRWGGFVLMDPTPSPNVVEVTCKKGWVAREAVARPKAGQPCLTKSGRVRLKVGGVRDGINKPDRMHDLHTASGVLPSSKKAAATPSRSTFNGGQSRRQNNDFGDIIKSGVGSVSDDGRMGVATQLSLAPVHKPPPAGTIASPPRLDRVKRKRGTAPLPTPFLEIPSQQLRPDHPRFESEFSSGRAFPGLGHKRKQKTRVRERMNGKCRSNTSV